MQCVYIEKGQMLTLLEIDHLHSHWIPTGAGDWLETTPLVVKLHPPNDASPPSQLTTGTDIGYMEGISKMSPSGKYPTSTKKQCYFV